MLVGYELLEKIYNFLNVMLGRPTDDEIKADLKRWIDEEKQVAKWIGDAKIPYRPPIIQIAEKGLSGEMSPREAQEEIYRVIRHAAGWE
jgi:hypothetical protein